GGAGLGALPRRAGRVARTAVRVEDAAVTAAVPIPLGGAMTVIALPLPLPLAVEQPGIRTAGIDMSLRATGVALSNGECRLFGEDKLTTQPWGIRIPKLTALALQIGGYAAGFKPDAVCIEGLDMAQSYGGQIERSYMWCLIIDVLLTDRI